MVNSSSRILSWSANAHDFGGIRYDLPWGLSWRKIISEGRLSKEISESLSNRGARTVSGCGVQTTKFSGVGGISPGVS
jgi:hypothetical protein